ncbi:Dihydrofolate reductase [Burkholderiales bacterium 8X]|nr:Dihydrofolate reductase [Burkholderiales bacterium 8X]
MTARINLILARAANGVIGHNGQMPWHLPEDMAHFRRLTGGSPVIMGRKTWESLPARFRPLPGRRNIVVTRQEQFDAPGAECAASLLDALALAEGAQPTEIFVIGGAQIYGEAEPLAHRAFVTEIDRDYEGDAWAPVFDVSWRTTSREAQVSADGIGFSFVTLERPE